MVPEIEDKGIFKQPVLLEFLHHPTHLLVNHLHAIQIPCVGVAESWRIRKIGSQLNLGRIMHGFLIIHHALRKMKLPFVRLSEGLHVKKGRVLTGPRAPCGIGRSFVPQFFHVMHKVVVSLALIGGEVTGLTQHGTPGLVTRWQLGHGGFSVILKAAAWSEHGCGQCGTGH